MITFEGLKKAVSDAFKNATEKTEIDKLAAINKAIADSESEAKKLEDDNKELKDAYLDAITHPGISKKANVEDNPTEIKKSDLADLILEAASKEK